HRIVRLTDPSSPGGPGFDEATRFARLTTLLDAYGMPYSVHEVLEMTIDRLEDLAQFSDRMAIERQTPELHDHAALYRRDTAWIREVLSRASRGEMIRERSPLKDICDAG